MPFFLSTSTGLANHSGWKPLKKLPDRLKLRINIKSVLSEFSRDTRHVRRFPCKDVPVLTDKLDERAFLFWIQVGTDDELFNRLKLGIHIKVVLSEFSFYTRHVRRFPCKDVPILMDELDEHAFLFGMHISPHCELLRWVAKNEIHLLGIISRLKLQQRVLFSVGFLRGVISAGSTLSL